MVKQKPFRRKRRRFFIRGNVPFEIPFKTIIRGVFVFALVFVFIYFVIYIFRSTLFKSEYYISTLRYSDASVKEFNDPSLYKIIKTQSKGENYYVLKYFKRDDILAIIKKKFPVVKNIEFHYSQKNTLDVKIIFDKIDLRFKFGDKIFALYKGSTFLLYSGNTIGNNIKTIELPGYLSGLNNLNGLFFNYPPEDFILNMDIISQVFGDNVRLVYLPGSKRVAVFIGKNKVVYINFQKDIKLQMTEYDFLRKYDSSFASYTEIDLGSLEGSMAIVKK
ncbi:MAG: hypothetical protein WAZ12_04625 [Candidatus Absconditicoccaceae bacterium]